MGSRYVFNFYVMKSYDIAKNSTATKVREKKLSADLESFEF
jgi:hypothetical protein